MSANAEVLGRRAWEESDKTEDQPFSRVEICDETGRWNPKDYAREQIKGLVRKVFFSSYVRPPKQIVFCATEPDIDMPEICDHVGCALSLETNADVAIVGRQGAADRMMRLYARQRRPNTIKSWSTQSAANLWRVPGAELREYIDELSKNRFWTSCLAKLRAEFEFSIIHGPLAKVSSEAILLGQLSDGVVLVLAAHSTRRAAARKIKETLENGQCRILGTVLSDRTFPVPDKIYHRL